MISTLAYDYRCHLLPSHGAQVIDTPYLTHRRLGPGLKNIRKEAEAPNQPLMTFPEQPRPFPVVFTQ